MQSNTILEAVASLCVMTTGLLCYIVLILRRIPIRYINEQQPCGRYGDEHCKRHGKYRQTALKQAHRKCP